MSRASWPADRSADTSVLSCMQLPQNMPAAPAVTYAMRMGWPRAGSVREGAFLGLGQPEGQQRPDGEDREADDRRGVGDAREPPQARRQGQEQHAQLRGGELAGGAEHAAADVGREALARAAQVDRVDAR